jgi:competence protein ComEC
VSHADSDHSGGAASVLAAQPQAALLASLPDGHALAAAHGATACAAGQRWEWDGVRFEVLHPAADAARDARPNTLSCVLRVVAAGRAALLAGDIEQTQELQLVAAGTALRADVLLVPHHGSRTSSTPAFLRAVAPRFALVQAGYRNRFGHPAPDVVRRLQAHGAVVVRSPACGAAQWRSEVPDRVACARAQQPRYWHHRVP